MVYRYLPQPVRGVLRAAVGKYYRERLVPTVRVLAAGPPEEVDRSLMDGVDLFGYFAAENGVGESVRSSYRALRSARISVTPHTLIARSFVNSDATVVGAMDRPTRSKINLLHVNADQTIFLPSLIHPENLRHRYTIGYWAWELAVFPDAWQAAFDGVNEIWVPSQFVRTAVAEKTNKPVRVIPHTVSGHGVDIDGREKFGLDKEACIFLCSFDFNSYVERKNPTAVVKAFRRAFPQGSAAENVRLVIKAHSGRMPFAKQRQTIKQEISGDDRIVLLDTVLDRREMTALQAACDVYVSLHRAEGFGLGIAESMAIGKPVIATAYSGSNDFVSADCACPVAYSLVPVKNDEYPFAAGQVWAEADVAAAAEYMRALAQQPDLRATLGGKAARKMEQFYSEEAVGKAIANRLAELSAQYGWSGSRNFG